MKKIAVVLSGCGYKDGSEITEAVSTLIALSELGVEYKMFAPLKMNPGINHLTGESESPRNALAEAARIGRGQVMNLNELNATQFDGLALPGGYGAAKVLCNFAEKGADCAVDPTAEKVIKDFYEQGKPIAGVCIAPALIARVLGSEGITVTIGDDAGTAAQIQKTGAIHENCEVNDYVSDRDHRIVTTPAYMFDDAKPSEVFKGIRGAMRELVEMA